MGVLTLLIADVIQWVDVELKPQVEDLSIADEGLIVVALLHELVPTASCMFPPAISSLPTEVWMDSEFVLFLSCFLEALVGLAL